ncbi:MAG: hemerythrin domain-containing protein [Sphingomicrobium sp.]
MDITQLIIDDHAEQRRLFTLLQEIPAKDTGALDAVWKRLGALLDTHAEAEERFFYPELLKLGKGAADADSAADETEDAIKDHNKIRDAGAAVAKCTVGTKEWFAAVDKANEENGDHLAEEERQGLADFRKNAPLDLRQRLAVQFAEFSAVNLLGVKPVDKDPDAYIKRNS